MRVKSTIKYLIILLLGFVFGVAVSIYLFAVEIDLLSLPYLNRTVELTEDISGHQGERKITIPEGSQIILRKRMPSSNEYCLLINSYWDDEKSIKFLPSKAKVFEVDSNP